MTSDDPDSAAQGDGGLRCGEVPGCADEGVPGEGQFGDWREDAHGGDAVVAEHVDEDRLRVAEVRRDRLHHRIAEQAVMDAEEVAATAVTSEDTDDAHGDFGGGVGHRCDRSERADGHHDTPRS